MEVPPRYKLLSPYALLTLPIYDKTLLLYGLSGPEQNVGLEWVSGWSGYPSWYTKVAYYKYWINCVIEKSAIYNNNQKKVEEECKGRASFKASCVNQENLIVQCDGLDAVEYKQC